MVIFKTLNQRQFFVAAMGIAIVIRLLLMPFFAHVDLFSEARRVFYVIENGHLFDNSHRFIVFYIEVIFAYISQLFINVSDGLFHLNDPTQSVASIGDYRYFLNDPNIYRHLFFFKLPYLLFDIATAVVIWKFVDNPTHKRIALLIWLFNPLTLYSTYIFGRFEVISLFFIGMCALQLKHDRVLLASFFFAIALHCREINLLYTPFLLLALIDHKDHWLRNLATLILCSALIYVIYILPNLLIEMTGGNIMLFVDPMIDNQSGVLNTLLSLGYHWFYPIIICLSVLAIYQWEISYKSKAERFVICASIVLFIYFGFNVHSAHYISWLVLLPILSMQFNRKVLLPFVALSGLWVVLWLLKTDEGVFTLFLAAPLNPDFIGTGHFPTLYQQLIANSSLTLHQSIQILRSLFLVVMGFFTYRVLRQRGNYDA